MVSSYREAPPLLFLTTSTSCAPTGRNARAQARSASAKRTNPAKAYHGSFGSFSVKDTKDEEERPRKKVKMATPPQEPSSRTAPQERQLLPLRILATHFHAGASPLPPNVNFEDVLRVASFHIRRQAAQIVNTDPDRTLEALRCRQWCSVSATRASLGRSPYLDSAIACVVSKVQQVVAGQCASASAASERMLVCYTEALQLLRAAVSEPALHDRLDMLAATHLLAIYEMLDFPNNASWTQHVDGAAALVKLPGYADVDNSELAMQAGPMFVEALMRNDRAFFESKHWRSLIGILVARQGSERGCETLACFTALRSIFADAQAVIEGASNVGWAVRMPLLARAHELRFSLRALILRSEKEVVKGKKNSKDCDVLGLYLVSFIMLDRLILTLRQEKARKGFNLEEDTQGLCNQMVRFELAASDADPGKEVLLALKRQARYPSLIYDV